ncbi:MAG: 3-methyladenine DNA glycosylase [Verrucomicrobiota bacterium]
MLAAAPPQALTRDQWRQRARRHAERLRPWLEPTRARRAAGRKHPVWDFLFTYYSHRPAELARWSPGAGVALFGADEETFPLRRGFAAIDLPRGPARWLDPEALPTKLRARAAETAAFLRATGDRAPNFACHGLHEWAMVYRAAPEAIRHAGVPLRLGPAGTDAVVEARPLACSHFDAFRFFTPEAGPRNRGAPTRERQIQLDQPGCVHVTMDLYKWAYRLSPWLASELVAEAFELAAAAREMDMCASPYDLRAFGFAPIPVETAAGRAEYERRQRELTARARPVRVALITALERLAADPV